MAFDHRSFTNKNFAFEDRVGTDLYSWAKFYAFCQ